MITATIVFFLAIFGGMAILGLLIWLIFRRRGNSSSNNQQFVGGSSQTVSYNQHQIEMADNDSDETDFVNNNYYSNEENSASGQTASDSPVSNENYESPAIQSDYSAPAEPIYSDNSSSYDAGGSSSSDSGSSSSDSGSSSSSSD